MFQLILLVFQRVLPKLARVSASACGVLHCCCCKRKMWTERTLQVTTVGDQCQTCWCVWTCPTTTGWWQRGWVNLWPHDEATGKQDDTASGVTTGSFAMRSSTAEKHIHCLTAPLPLRLVECLMVLYVSSLQRPHLLVAGTAINIISLCLKGSSYPLPNLVFLHGAV